MSDQPEPSATAKAAQRALELKRAGAVPGAPKARFPDERAAAARSASKSKPALRK